MNLAFLPFIVPAVSLLIIAAYDLAAQRIPNTLVALIVIAGIAFLLALGDFQRARWAALAFVVMLLVGFGLFALGGFGAGDAKLLAATSLWIAPSHYLPFLIMMGLGGGALVVAYKFFPLLIEKVSRGVWALMIKAEKNRQWLRYLWVGSPLLNEKPRALQVNAVPYGVAIAFAGIYCLCLEMITAGYSS